MNKFTALIVITIIIITGLGAASCSSGSDTATTGGANTNQAKPPANSANTAPKPDEETPGNVKAAFPNAQSFTKQHKDIPPDAIATIEKDTGGKVPDTDHHSYLAFSNEGGTRRQIGAATVVNGAGKEFVIVYENKEGSPFIKEVRGDGVPADFLKQFAGKGHDDKFTFGTTIKANGADETAAKALTTAIAVDVMTMQSLYGAAHTH